MNDPIAPLKTDVPETEELLIDTAQQAVNQCRWVVGECAAKWTKKYAKGRTDADFAALINLSGDQVFQRRRVWESFADVHESYPKLKWSHFYSAINWDDAAECLQWAEETQATVAEMKAWRRAIHGEDLTAEAEEDESAVAYVPSETTAVVDPDEFGGEGSTASEGGNSSRDRKPETATATAAARQKEDTGGEYSPFRQGATTPPATSDQGGDAVGTAVGPPVAQLVKRTTKALQRFETAITPQFVQEFRKLPEQTQSQFIKAVEELNSKVAELL
ncbi:hypothetical protein [Symmachiella dynata]|uniref:type II toxin-antitoxin system RelE family toxin n=1 Tax=Symmachiella dynata TaxID=2527995 RepID=UPI0030EF7F84